VYVCAAWAAVAKFQRQRPFFAIEALFHCCLLARVRRASIPAVNRPQESRAWAVFDATDST